MSLLSLFWPHFHCRSQFLAPAKNCRFLRFIHNNNNLYVFSECTEAITTALIPLETIVPEKCAFNIGFSCTVWTKMRSLTGSLADGVLADAFLIPPHSPILPTNIRKVKGHRKKYRNQEKRNVGIVKHFSTKYRIQIKIMSRCLSAPDATST